MAILLLGPSDLWKSRIMRSAASFAAPYGLTGNCQVFSVMGIFFELP
jgi:hypothetical protein